MLSIRFPVALSCIAMLFIAGQFSEVYSLNAPSLSKVTALDSNRILVSWSLQTNLKGIYLLRKSGPSDFSCIDTLAGTDTSWLDSTVHCGDNYYYCLISFTSSEISAQSSALNAVTPPCGYYLQKPVIRSLAFDTAHFSITVIFSDNSTADSAYTITNNGKKVASIKSLAPGDTGPITFHDATCAKNSWNRYRVKVLGYNGTDSSDIDSVFTYKWAQKDSITFSKLSSFSIQNPTYLFAVGDTIFWEESTAVITKRMENISSPAAPTSAGIASDSLLIEYSKISALAAKYGWPIMQKVPTEFNLNPPSGRPTTIDTLLTNQTLLCSFPYLLYCYPSQTSWFVYLVLYRYNPAKTLYEIMNTAHLDYMGSWFGFTFFL